MTDSASPLAGGHQGSVVDIHHGYRSLRILHEPPDELVSATVTYRTLRPHLLRLVIVAIVEAVLLFFSLIFGLLAAAGQASSGLSGGAFGALAGLLGLLMVVVGITWIVSLFLPVREPIAEYGILLENRAPAAGTTYDWIAQTIRTRGTPFGLGEVTADGQRMLTLESGLARGAVIVRPYGVDLYLGWTMWRRRSTVLVVWHLIRDIIEEARGGAMATDVQLANTRAFREIVHSVTREGAQAAIQAGGTAR